MGVLVAIPDTHGVYRDKPTVDAIAEDIALLRPNKLVHLGDLVDAASWLSAHQNSWTDELEYTYQEDCAGAQEALDKWEGAAKGVEEKHLTLGNHDTHAERWASRTFNNAKDAKTAASVFDPVSRLKLKQRGWRCYYPDQSYHGLNIEGACRIGKALFLHGYTAGPNATAKMLDQVGTNLVHGHNHRAAYLAVGTAISPAIAAWCPGTASLLKMPYMRGRVNRWTHGYFVSFYDNDGSFCGWNVPIVNGKSMLQVMLKQWQPIKMGGKRPGSKREGGKR